ncbi:hypothetical protein Hanom_Chr11g01002511 [Helianthus anomalus]
MKNINSKQTIKKLWVKHKHKNKMHKTWKKYIKFPVTLTNIVFWTETWTRPLRILHSSY